MNEKLVNSLVQVIESLSEAERGLLREKLSRKQLWKENKQRLYEIHQCIRRRNGGSPLEVSAEAMIEQERQQRDQQLLDVSSV